MTCYRDEADLWPQSMIFLLRKTKSKLTCQARSKCAVVPSVSRAGRLIRLAATAFTENADVGSRVDDKAAVGR
jgi:hypothetical protein